MLPAVNALVKFTTVNVNAIHVYSSSNIKWTQSSIAETSKANFHWLSEASASDCLIVVPVTDTYKNQVVVIGWCTLVYNDSVIYSYCQMVGLFQGEGALL